MGEKLIVKRMATCNSCEHFKEARRGDWVGYTPVCTQCPTQIGINKYKSDSEKQLLGYLIVQKPCFVLITKK